MFRPIAAVALALAALLSAGCSSHPLQRVSDPNDLSAGAKTRNVWAEASFLTDHPSVFGTDLVRDHRIVPVAISMGYQEPPAPRADLLKMEFRLFLADGTALKFRPYDELDLPATVRDRVVENAFRKLLLDPWAEAKHGRAFVFFELPPEAQLEVLSATRVRHLSEPLWRELELADSLLSFVYTDDEGKWPVNVGLAESRS